MAYTGYYNSAFSLKCIYPVSVANDVAWMPDAIEIIPQRFA